MSVRPALAVMMILGVGVTACSRGEAQSQPTFTVPTFVTSTVAGADGTAPEPEASTTTAAVASPVTTTPPISGVPQTVAPATTEPPPTIATTLPPTTTTEPISVQELILRSDGIGSAKFGAEPEGVIDYITSILGGNTADTGWVDPLTFAVCDGNVARRVDWGVLSLLFSDLSDVAIGRRHFMGYEYGRVGQIGDEPVGLRTEGGTTIGSRVVDLQADFPQVIVNEGEQDINIPPNFYVNDNFYGLITGVNPDDVVTNVFGGYGCGV